MDNHSTLAGIPWALNCPSPPQSISGNTQRLQEQGLVIHLHSKLAVLSHEPGSTDLDPSFAFSFVTPRK